MLAVTTVLLTLVSSSADVASACSPVIAGFPAYSTRNEYVVLDATPDSVGVPFFEDDAGGREPFARQAPATSNATRRTVIYAQVFRVRALSGEQPARLRPGATVLVIWWGLGTACSRRPPYAATKPEIRSLFIHGTARPADDWADSVPLFDAWHDRYLFSPELPTPRFNGEREAPEPLSMADFLAFLRLLPRPEELGANDSVAVAPLFRWANENPSRWRRTPAREALCTALWARRLPRSHCPPSLLDTFSPEGFAPQRKNP
jgi:hypothetical protein